ncbi:MAG: pilus assembly protein PilY [Pseudomonadales bacterium]|nr:pilus assembly protein PilY [Pseudomonadales bacterium]
MKLRWNRVLSFCTGLGLSLASGISTADDTEVYFNTQQTSIRPNILFILDNSGSMRANVQVTVPVDPVFDPDKSYSGGFETDDIYFKINSNSGWSKIDRNRLACDDMDDRIDQVGRLVSYKMVYKRGRRWRNFDWRHRADRWVDCEADNDISFNWPSANLRDFYVGNYLNWQNSSPTTVWKTRLEIMQEVANDLADTVSGVNIGLMTFNEDQSSEGGRVRVPVENVADNRDSFKASVNSLYPATNTPLSETLFGARRYFAGGAPFLDKTPVGSTIGSDKNFISPIDMECQANNIVLLTDGEPTADTNHNSTIAKGIGINGCSGNCLDEIAKNLKEHDVSSAYAGDQTVNTYTVGFQLNDPLLSATANAGGGKYYIADSAEELASAFNDIIRNVLETSSTFVSPGIAVNTFNRLNHLDSLYYTVFTPSTKTLWDGNLKRYKLVSSGEIRDVNDNDAVDPNTGFFKDSAVSWWTPTADPDGRDVKKGGVRENLPSTVSNRKVYTWLSGSDLTASDNLLVSTNSAITKSMLGNGSMADSDRTSLIQWIRGADSQDINGNGDTSESRNFIADPLHSVPKLVVYGGTEANPDTAVFFGDNQGFLHAVNGATGELYFSFMPKELLGRQAGFMAGEEINNVRPYGIDGSVVAWIENGSGNIDAGAGDHVYLYVGMRRGGRNYYALDATNRDRPKALWNIIGGTGDFAELGESWADPVKTKVNIGGSVKDALVISGGYDPDQDDVHVRTEDDMGRAIYIVDAETGNRLWWAGPSGSGANLEIPELKYSIPATPKVLDLSGNGMLDQVYVGDMGGQVLRFDFSNGKVADSFGTGGVVANLAGNTEASARRFYHTPDVAFLKFWGQQYLSIAIGSGWHAHPLDKVIEDRFYMLRVPFQIGAPLDGTGAVDYGVAATESDLYDAYSNIIGNGSKADQKTAEVNLSGKKGWFFDFDNAGEKVMAPSTTYDGKIYFTTYEPAPSLSACQPSVGRARLYTVYQRDARPVRKIDGVHPDRWQDLDLGDPPSPPSTVRIDDKLLVCVGPECIEPPQSNTFEQYFWREEE